MKKKMKKAFTLVELLVVIAILAILSTVAIVGYNSFTEKAQKSVDQQAVTQMNNVVEAAGVLENIETGADAYEAIMENGYDGGFKTAYGAYSMAWLAEEKAVVLVTQEAVAFPEEYAGTSLDKVSPLYTVEPVTTEDLIDALTGTDSNYVNVNIPETGLVLTGDTSKLRIEIGKNVTTVINLEGDLSSTVPYTLIKAFGNVTINGNGNHIVTVNPQPGSDVVINDAIIGYENSRLQAIGNFGGNLEVNNCTFINNAPNDGNDYSYVVNHNSGTTVINDCTYSGISHGMFASITGTLTINGGTYTLNEGSTAHMFYGVGGVIDINGGTYTVKNSGGMMCCDIDTTGGLFLDTPTGTFNLRGENLTLDTKGVVGIGNK